MSEKDIDRLRKILRNKGKSNLSEILQYSYSIVEQSSTYGSCYCSTLSTFDIYSPLKFYEILQNLSEGDKKTIHSAVLLLYPIKENAPEITEIRFFLDIDLEPEHELSCKYLKELNFDYIREQLEKCNDKINKGDYGGAITNSRTLVESICIYILDESGQTIEHDGNLIKLYKELNKVLKMEPSLYQEDCFKQILSGLTSIINGLSNLRNIMSDAHGCSQKKYYKPDIRHAILAVNSAKVITEFLYASWKSRNPNNK